MNPDLKNVSICSQHENCQISLKIVGLKTVLNLVSNLSQNLRQFWDMKGITVILSQLRIRVSRRLGISATKHRVAALVIEMQKFYD